MREGQHDSARVVPIWPYIDRMIADTLINRLHGVRESGPGRWIARCPVHDDRSPSLAVRNTGDRLLLHCFAGCDVYTVVAAVGLKLTDLFPPRFPDPAYRGRPERYPIPAADILRCVAAEATYIMICARDLARGTMLTPDDMDRLAISATRIRASMLAGGLA